MNLNDAIYNTAHDHGGTVELGKRMGISGAILRAKVNPHDDSRCLTLPEADKMMGLTGDYRILHALADAHEHIVMPKSESAMDSNDQGLYCLILGFFRGRDSERDINKVLAGIDEFDGAAMRRKIYDLQTQLSGLLHHLDGEG